jgi:hypothetical protein
MKKSLLGKVFISHSSVDKPLVRRLSRRIEREGFTVWLDERELVAGDSLARNISDALDSARVVLVVVSKASIKSKWLSFEVNKATDRMVKGECRVIPAVVETVILPSEVGGLLYADFTSSFELGSRAVITALENEVSALENKARREAIRKTFRSRVELALFEIFGPTGYTSLMGEYRSINYHSVSLPIPSEDDDRTDITYEIIPSYGRDVKPLPDRWWREYEETIREVPEKLFLVITERPIGFSVQAHDAGSRLAVKVVRDWQQRISQHVVFAELSGLAWKSQYAILKKTQTLLVSLATELRPESRDSNPEVSR